MQEDAESNVKEENVDEGDIVLTLSRRRQDPHQILMV